MSERHRQAFHAVVVQGLSLRQAADEADTRPKRIHDLLREAWEPENRDRDDVTMVLVEAREGPSAFDNSNATASGTLDRPPSTRNVSSILYGESEQSTHVEVRGRGTYMLSDSFYDAVCSVLDARRGLTLDLSSCVYLDSTFLGIIHEVVQRADTAGLDGAGATGTSRWQIARSADATHGSMYWNCGQKSLPSPSAACSAKRSGRG